MKALARRSYTINTGNNLEMNNRSSIENHVETPNDRFTRLSAKRLARALESIRLLGNLANTSNYSYSDTQISAILNALLEANAQLEKQFLKGL